MVSGGENNQLLTGDTRSTAFNTNAAPSSDGVSEQEDVDFASMSPLEGFEWRGLEWPDQNCLELPVTQYGKEIKLKAMRWPAANERRGVVFILHGYGSYTENMAIIAKYLAEQDYEVFGMDMRGQGDSEGIRGCFENTDQVYNDYW